MRTVTKSAFAFLIFSSQAAATLRTSTAKAQLFQRIGDLRREPSVAARKAVLAAVEAVEASIDTGEAAPVEGRWSLIFSTQVSAREEQRSPGDSALLQALIDTTYSAFFKVAPALAGAQQDGATSSASNEQWIDLTNCEVRNRVRVTLPFTKDRLEIRVNGDAKPAGTDATNLQVVFRECSFQLGAKGSWPVVSVPLPRPVGSLRTTHVDDELRISRGGRGGVFVLRRMPDS